MIYADTSVVLAALFAEDRRPAAEFWNGPLIASRLLEYEAWIRVNSRGVSEPVRDAARLLVGSIDLVELAPSVLARALEPFPRPVRTLDAIHLATVDHLREQGMRVRFATYDRRLAAVARAMKFDAFEP